MSTKILIIILGMAAVTFTIRYLPFVAFRKIEFHGFTGRLLNYLPPAIMGGLVFQALFIKDSTIYLPLKDFTLIAAGISTIVAITTNNLLLTVLSGVGVMALFQLMI